MVAKKTISIMKDKRGQSLLEVMLLIPFLFGFVGILYKVNMAVQMSINNSQYARAQIYVLAANSPEYPRLGLRMSPEMFGQNGQDRMVLGVSDPEALSTSSGQSGKIEPMPQIQDIARNKTTVTGSSDRGEVKNRTKIRVRNTAAICTQLNVQPNTENKRWPFGTEVCRYGGMI